MKKLPLLLIPVAILALIALMSVFTVKETERAVVVRLGKIIKPDVEPGLHFKVPFIDELKRFDARNQILDAPPTKYLTSDKEYLDVDSYIVWRIKDVQKFYVSTNGSMALASSLLERRALDVLKNKVAERSLNEVISGEREELMQELTVEVSEDAKNELGVEVVDIRVKRVDFPKETIADVYKEMQAGLKSKAELYRAEGRRDATKIIADADRQSQILVAEGEGASQRIRGEGDALAADIYARAYNKNPEFYKFYRSIKAYETAFSSKDDILVISPDSEFFDYLKQSK